jgi:hypothetical protein
MAVIVEPKLVWLVGRCQKGGKPDVTDLCSSGYVPVLYENMEEAADDIDSRLPLQCVVILPSCNGNVETFTDAVRSAWPRVNVCVAACSDNCRAPGMLACALTAVDTEFVN